MVDTARTRAALQVLLADTGASDITPQDVRDFLVSVFPQTTKGDLIGIGADGILARLPGSTDGYLLVLDAAEALGFKWVAPSSGVAHDILSATHTDTTPASLVQGDILVVDSVPSLVRLAKPTSNGLVYFDGSDVAWTVDATAILSYDPANALLTFSKEGASAGFKPISYSSVSVDDAGAVALGRHRGTFAAPSAVLLGDVLGVVTFSGGRSAVLRLGAYLQAVANQNFAAGNQGTRFEFYTTPDGATTPILVVTFKADGDLDVVNNILMAAGKTVDGVDISAHDHGAGGGTAVDASAVTYTPAVATDWDADADPGDVDNALDQLAERVDDIEGAAGHVAVTLAADADTILSLSTQEIGLDTQTANTVLAGPTTGVPADPAFRALVDADIPAAIARDSEVTTAVSDHAAAADPHTGYQKESEKDAASGYAGLTAGTKLNLAQMQEVMAYADLTDDPVGDHLGDAADAHDASAISILDTAAQYTATDVEAALAEVLDAEQAHEADAADAHDASAISVLDTAAQYTATDVEAALAEVLDALQAHEADTADAHDASAISNVPAGSVAATTVQAAIDELATDYAAADHAEAHGIAAHTEHATWKALYTDGSGDEQELALGAAATFYRSAGTAAAPTMSALVVGDLPASLLASEIPFIIGGGGSAITTGIKGDLVVPFNCTVTGWTALADQSGSIVCDLWYDTYANYPPTVADTITGTEKPTITTATKGQDLTLTTWTTVNLTAGQTLRFNIDSVTAIQRVLISLKVTRT